MGVTFAQLEGLTFEQVDQVFLLAQERAAWAPLLSQLDRLIAYANRRDGGGGPFDRDAGIVLVVRGSSARLLKADEAPSVEWPD